MGVPELPAMAAGLALSMALDPLGGPLGEIKLFKLTELGDAIKVMKGVNRKAYQNAANIGDVIQNVKKLERFDKKQVAFLTKNLRIIQDSPEMQRFFSKASGDDLIKFFRSGPADEFSEQVAKRQISAELRQIGRAHV